MTWKLGLYRGYRKEVGLGVKVEGLGLIAGVGFGDTKWTILLPAWSKKGTCGVTVWLVVLNPQP